MNQWSWTFTLKEWIGHKTWTYDLVFAPSIIYSLFGWFFMSMWCIGPYHNSIFHLIAYLCICRHMYIYSSSFISWLVGWHAYVESCMHKCHYICVYVHVCMPVPATMFSCMRWQAKRKWEHCMCICAKLQRLTKMQWMNSNGFFYSQFNDNFRYSNWKEQPVQKVSGNQRS